MRIVGQNTYSTDLAPGAKARTAKGEAADRGDAVAQDTVKLSESSGAAARALTADDAARAARIAEVKAQIESGGYPLDFQRLADTIVADELARGGA